MSDREEKLDRLHYKQAARDMQVSINGGALLDTMDKVDELKSLLGNGVEIKNIDELVDQLKEINSLAPIVTELKEAINGIKIPQMPDDIEIKGLDDLVRAAQVIAKKKEGVAKVDISTVTPITDQVGNLITAIEAIQVPKQGQQPNDYVPMRRVVQVGNKFMFDDSFYTGGGGGGATIPNPLSVTGSITSQGIGRSTYPSAVADGAAVNPLYSTTGKAIVEGAVRAFKGNQQTTITSSTAETTIVTADVTYKLDLYGLILTNTSATATKVTIKDTTSGTTRMVFYVPATDTRGFMVSEDSGHKQTAANNNWTATCGTSVASLEVTCMFVQNV